MTRNMTSKIVAASAVLALGMGAIATANAANVFTIDPNSLTGVTGGATFDADHVGGLSSTRVTNIAGTTNYTATGWIQYQGFQLNGTTIPSPVSQLNTNYGLYATFTQTFTCGSLLSPGGAACSVSGIDLNLYADIWDNNYAANHDDFTQAAVGVDPTVTDNGGNDVLLATVNQVYQGVAGIDALGGAYENVNTNFALTAAGQNYFINPVPFYEVALSEFNNTSSGIACDTAGCVNATDVAINNESGSSTLAPVPEPSTVALFGVGLLVMGASLRRRLS